MLDLNKVTNKFQQCLGRRDTFESSLVKAQMANKKATKDYEDALVAQSIIHKAAKNTQAKLKFSIEKIVTAAVLSVFEDKTYEFVVDFETKNNRTHCLLSFKDESGEMFNGEDDLGGSVVDISSFAARVSLWTLMKENRTVPIFLLDESMKHLSEGYRGAGSALLRAFCDKIGMQIIISTHLTELIADADHSIMITKEGEWSVAHEQE